MYPRDADQFETAASSDASAAGSGRPAPGHADTPTRSLPVTEEASEQAGGSATTDTGIAAGSGEAAPGGSALPDPHSPGGRQDTATAILHAQRLREERRVDAVALALIAAESNGYVTVESFREKYGDIEAKALMARGRQKAREFIAMLDAAVKFDFDEMEHERSERVRAGLMAGLKRAVDSHGQATGFRYKGDHS